MPIAPSHLAHADLKRDTDRFDSPSIGLSWRVADHRWFALASDPEYGAVGRCGGDKGMYISHLRQRLLIPIIPIGCLARISTDSGRYPPRFKGDWHYHNQSRC